MKTTTAITDDTIKHLAKLANLPISDDRFAVLADQIKATFANIDTIQKASVDNYAETNQVNGLQNVLREDVVDSSRTFTQEQALQNAPHSHQGYFLVPAVLE